MYIIVSTPTETCITDISTMQLYNSEYKLVAKGFLRIMAAMWNKNIVALKSTITEILCGAGIAGSERECLRNRLFLY